MKVNQNNNNKTPKHTYPAITLGFSVFGDIGKDVISLNLRMCSEMTDFELKKIPTYFPILEFLELPVLCVPLDHKALAEILSVPSIA